MVSEQHCDCYVRLLQDCAHIGWCVGLSVICAVGHVVLGRAEVLPRPSVQCVLLLREACCVKSDCHHGSRPLPGVVSQELWRTHIYVATQGLVLAQLITIVLQSWV